MSTTIRRRLAPALLAALLLVTVLPSVAAAATRPTRFQLYLNSSCVGGVSSDGAMVELTWRRASGKLVHHATYTAGTFGGYWEACAGDGFTTPRLKIGDQLEAKVGATVRRFTVPTLTLRFDRAANLFKGRAPADTSIRLAFPLGLYADYEVDRRVPVGSDGTWRYREPGFDIMGGQYAYMRWKSARNDLLTVDAIAPLIRLTLADSRFTGAQHPGVSFQARLLDGSSGEVLGTGKATATIDGVFAGRFRDSAGELVPVSAGMRVKALQLATDANWIVPNITGSANADSDVVKGRCFDAGTSDRWYEARVFAPDGDTRALSAGSTSSNGSFEVDFGDESNGMFYSPGDVRSGDRLVIGCLQRSGDFAQREIIVP